MYICTIFQVCSTPESFSRYLQDAKKVFLQVLSVGSSQDKGSSGTEIGFAALYGLNRLVEGKERVLDEDLAVIDGRGQQVGTINCR